ncbi:DUF3047 domain-containing protein [Limnohabitans sp. DM1]|uniref:DUF3047 domain-containing protein n=1 Tax=Limnohabitans sp. DM1 TaxID=1597955 RepID=UPI000AF9B617|nr:DUF3047 domain-containing protein [Limnohabitans sp. DM1]
MARHLTALAAAGLLALSAHATSPLPLSGPLWPLTSQHSAQAQGWRFVGLPNKPQIATTRFELGQIDGVAGVQIQTDKSYGTWAHDWRGTARTLQWRWRLDQALSGGLRPADLRRKDGDDAALKVCVMFDHALDRVPFGERTLLRVARSVSGENLPAATVCYLWDPLQASGTKAANPYSRRVRYVVLQGPSAPLQQWLSESRDVAQDFLMLFGDELPAGSAKAAVPPVSAVVIGADSDNTQAHSSGWVAQLQWH